VHRQSQGGASREDLVGDDDLVGNQHGRRRIPASCQ
jgi:hypothetical protein